MAEIKKASGRLLPHAPLPAKITRPEFAAITLRERLFKKLDKCLEKPVTWVAGPPGAGKTALLSSYIDARGIPYVWYQLDEGDEEPESLFYYLAKAARFYTREDEYESLPVFTGDQSAGLIAFANRFFETLFRQLPPSSLLIFDDYQEIPEKCAFHGIMRAALRQIPLNLTIILASRGEPPQTLMRMRANDRMSFMGWRDLRLTLEETRNLILQKSGKQISDDIIRELHQFTDGWAAGLILLTEDRTMELRAQAPPRSAAGLPHEHIFDYFAGEILDRTDEVTHAFLCKTALLPWMTGFTASRVSQNPRAENMLWSLCRANAFIERRRASTVYYQYHPLFRRFLLNRLSREATEQEMADLRQKAARILEGEGAIVEAMKLFLDAGNWEDTTRILMQNAPVLISRGGLQTMEYRLAGLPEEEIEKNPWLVFWLGMCRISHHPEEARALLEKAYQRFEKNRDKPGQMLAWSGIVDTHLHIFNTFALVDQWLSKIDRLLEATPPDISAEVESKTLSSMILAMALRNPAHPEIESLMQRGRKLAEICEPLPVKIQAFLPLGFCRIMLGDFREVAALIKRFGMYVDNPEISPLLKIMHKDLIAFFCWKTARFDRCFRAFEEGLAILNEIEIPGWRIFLLGHAAAAALSLGDTADAQHKLDQAATEVDMARAWAKCYYHVLNAWNAMIPGDAATAVYHSDAALELAFASGEKHSIAVAHLGKAIALQMSGRLREAGENLAYGRSLDSVTHNKFMEFQYALAEADLSMEKSVEEKYTHLLRHALGLGRKHEYFNTYFWRPHIMSRLCAAALEMGIETEYVRRLIRVRSLVPGKLLFYVPEWPWPVKIFALGKFKVMVNDQPLQFTRKAQQRPLDLLKALLAAGGIKGVEKSRICDMLWPDSEGDAAESALSTTLHRLRKLLTNDQAVKLEEGRIFLNEKICWADIWHLQAILDNLNAALQTDPEVKELDPSILFMLRKAIALHSGEFLAGEIPEKHWAIPMCDQLREGVAGCCLGTGEILENLGRQEEALFFYRKGREIDPLNETFYQRLLVCYNRLGRRSEAIREYRRCRQTLAEHLDCEPSAWTRALYESL
ncbi:MAG: BTAD domain-containing putative transcriptional regulator [Desulfobacterales bacterium]